MARFFFQEKQAKMEEERGNFYFNGSETEEEDYLPEFLDEDEIWSSEDEDTLKMFLQDSKQHN